MSKPTQQQIDERYEKLPEVLKDAMFSPDIADKMVEIGKKSGLTLDKIGEVAEETGYVVLGLTAPKDFVKALEERLGTDAAKASDIAKEINHHIFYPLREELKKAHNIEIKMEDMQKREPLIRPGAPVMPPAPSTIHDTRNTMHETEPDAAKSGSSAAPKPPSVSPVTARPAPMARPAPPASPTTQPRPMAQEQKPIMPPTPLSEKDLSKPGGGIFFETKSKVPPIDLRQAAKPSNTTSSAFAGGAAKGSAAEVDILGRPAMPPNAVDLRGEAAPKLASTPAPAPAAVPTPPPQEKPKYAGTDPYRESAE